MLNCTCEIDADPQKHNTLPNGAASSLNYDTAGNRTLRVEPGVNETAVYNAANQLVSINPSTGSGQAFSYDANGNLLDDGNLAYRTTTLTGSSASRRR